MGTVQYQSLPDLLVAPITKHHTAISIRLVARHTHHLGTTDTVRHLLIIKINVRNSRTHILNRFLPLFLGILVGISQLTDNLRQPIEGCIAVILTRLLELDQRMVMLWLTGGATVPVRTDGALVTVTDDGILTAEVTFHTKMNHLTCIRLCGILNINHHILEIEASTGSLLQHGNQLSNPLLDRLSAKVRVQRLLRGHLGSNVRDSHLPVLYKQRVAGDDRIVFL